MNPLHQALRLNAATCLGFGIVFLANPEMVAAYLGAFPEMALRLIGGALVFNGLHLIVASRRQSISALEVFYFVTGDISWFVATLLVLASGALITTKAGSQVALAVGIGVALVGLRQTWTYAEATHRGIADGLSESAEGLLPPALSRGRAIGSSWLAMKTWVKLWLFALNGIFLAAIGFWPTPLAKYTLAAYVASGPLLFVLVVFQRGMTRVTGLAHLIAWLPLICYLGLRLSGDMVGPQITVTGDPMLFGYSSLLTAMIAICLLFDIYDVARWLGGNRARLGSPSQID